MKLILASNSKWRKEIIEMAGLKCETMPSNIKEDISFSNPNDYVVELSKMKAYDVAKRVDSGIIISADTIGFLDDEKFEKPKSREEAFNNLRKLSGRVNYAVTGVTIIDKYKNKEVSFADSTAVYFKDMNDDEINWYIDHEKGIYECAGYSMETCGSLFVTRVDGDYKNIVGLPINRIYDELKNFGYSINDFETI